ncbi:MAG: hypothetical protein GXP62_18045 [Oligoflexia bacterium]|nr:hypothetical protein [Oligoflexia bacterium]
MAHKNTRPFRLLIGVVASLSVIALSGCGGGADQLRGAPSAARRVGAVSLGDADLAVHLSAEWTFMSAAGVGDLSGDGQADLAVAVTTGPSSSRVFLVPGPLTGDVQLPRDAWVSISDVGDTTLGDGTLVALGDSNGDGWDDLALGAPGAAGDDGRVYIFEGPLPRADLVLGDASVELYGAQEERAGSALLAADLTGDGVVDLAVGAPEAGTATGYDTWSPGRVYVVPGPFSSGDLDPLAVAVIEGDSAYSAPIMANVGASLALLDDENGDGLPELAFGAPETWQENQEGSVGVANSPFQGTIGWADLAVRYGGNSLYHLGTGLLSVDVSGDGRRDLIANSHDGVDNEVCIWTETVPDGTAADCSTVIYQTLRYYGASTIEVAAAGDQDGDGQDDLLMHITGLGEELGGDNVGLIYGPIAEGVMVIEDWSDFDAWFAGAQQGLEVGDADGDGATDMALVAADGAGAQSLYVFFAEPEAALAEAPAEPLSMAEVQPGDLVVSEIMANPSVCSDATSEWIEVHNTTQQAIDLEGLVLVDVANTEGRIGSGSIVDAGGFAVLGIGSADRWCDESVTVDGYYGSTPKWNNSGPETVFLTWQGQVIDQSATYDKAASGGASLALPDGAEDTDDLSLWCVADPTPGAANRCR